ncbi:hypothetical protein HLB25_13315 [Dickeya dadantii]|uniref:hypothetical protein n=1 Tax=Dickeya dadantii TaxID=204038 RepID=UPI001495BB38|nr:hypothetical protein [Dickeya dadantii]NPE55882.1 hypothetical protein [Dickeya dadantii]NPE67654.1 hypothetical protein [Dickeya dadantii]
MSTDERLYIRVSGELKIRIEERAVSYGGINKYINSIIQRDINDNDFREQVINNLNDIHSRVFDNGHTKENGKDSAVIEILIYMRMLSSPEIRNKVNAEMKRMGFKTWSFDNEQK